MVCTSIAQRCEILWCNSSTQTHGPESIHRVLVRSELQAFITQHGVDSLACGYYLSYVYLSIYDYLLPYVWTPLISYYVCQSLPSSLLSSLLLAIIISLYLPLSTIAQVCPHSHLCDDVVVVVCNQPNCRSYPSNS
jgi:hypothetical protein